MKIGVCIPCCFSGLKYINRLLLSIENQTIKPDIVCISISGISENIDLPVYTTTFDLNIIRTINNKNAAENRNIAALKIRDIVDILSFFDVDDYMHPQRLESIKNVFSNHNCDFFLHNYLCVSRNLEDVSIIHSNINTIDIINDVENRVELQHSNSNFICGFKNNIDVPLANGHISCRSSLFFTEFFPENAIGYEDSKFSGDLFIKKYICKFTSDKLSLYFS